jgi:hypothetical protein
MTTYDDRYIQYLDDMETYKQLVQNYEVSLVTIRYWARIIALKDINVDAEETGINALLDFFRIYPGLTKFIGGNILLSFRPKRLPPPPSKPLPPDISMLRSVHRLDLSPMLNIQDVSMLGNANMFDLSSMGNF